MGNSTDLTTAFGLAARNLRADQKLSDALRISIAKLMQLTDKRFVSAKNEILFGAGLLGGTPKPPLKPTSIAIIGKSIQVFTC